jgi:hypothetical protein
LIPKKNAFRLISILLCLEDVDYINFIHLIFQEAMNLIEPLTNDPVNYVRQGALIASVMILVQQNEVTCPKVGHIII